MEENGAKPRLLFFQWRHEKLPEFLQLHMKLHVKCLAEFFEVILINQDCDYQQVCDLYHPDIALFESGFRTKVSRKIKIKNTSAYSKIPKLGLHNGDSWCDCRVGFISDMDQWGIETFFSICTTTAEHTPEIAENLFVWPNFIDSEICHDYGQAKVVPILFTGLMNSLYPWRQKIYKIISAHYPSTTLPHQGYQSQSQTMIQGEQYARTINTSWFVPTCGTIAKDAVRKHFEIPGSKSCLITEKTPSLEAAGFVDMQNCVFADEKDVLDKLNYLFENRDDLNKMLNSGYELVQSRHTLKQRGQIFQWYNLNRNINGNEKIVQLNPFEPLVAVTNSSGIQNAHIVCDGLHLVLLRKGDEKLSERKFDEAEALYLKCLHYIDWMREPKLKLTICNLYKGNVDAAFRWIIEPVLNNSRVYKAFDPDPIEWAYFIISLLCRGRLNESIVRSRQFPSLQHPELDRVRFVIDYLENKENRTFIAHPYPHKPRRSIHQLPEKSFIDWINDLSLILRACHQVKYAETLGSLISADEVTVAKLAKRKINLNRFVNKRLILLRIICTEKLKVFFKIRYLQDPKQGSPPISQVDYFIRLSKREKIDLAKRIFFKFL